MSRLLLKVYEFPSEEEVNIKELTFEGRNEIRQEAEDLINELNQLED